MTIKQGKTTITIESKLLYTSRLLNNKLYALVINLDGTIEDLLAKVNRVNKLDDKLYKQFSELSREVKSYEDE